MTIPLYKLKDGSGRENLAKSLQGNSGLVFNKCFSYWESGTWSVKEGGKADWVRSFSNGPVGNRDLITEAIARRLNLVEFTAGSWRCYRTEWRFATGLGLNHPIENGMTWHHTLGVPYLPGSSLKGLVRAWVELWLDSHHQTDIDRIFGPGKTSAGDDNESAEGAGSVIFFDALPTAPVRLAPDVMTPHYQDYYSKGEPPGDWMDPNPIPFLTVAGDQVFLFAIAPRERGNKANQSDLEMVFQWLNEALENIGAGAKTAAGYGRFKRCNRTENKMQSSAYPLRVEKPEPVSSIPQELAGPIANEMIADQYDAVPEIFLKNLKTKWLPRMHTDGTKQIDQHTIAKLLKNWYHTHREGQWEKPNKKNAPIVKAIRKILGEESSQ